MYILHPDIAPLEYPLPLPGCNPLGQLLSRSQSPWSPAQPSSLRGRSTHGSSPHQSHLCSLCPRRSTNAQQCSFHRCSGIPCLSTCACLGGQGDRSPIGSHCWFQGRGRAMLLTGYTALPACLPSFSCTRSLGAVSGQVAPALCSQLLPQALLPWTPS